MPYATIDIAVRQNKIGEMVRQRSTELLIAQGQTSELLDQVTTNLGKMIRPLLVYLTNELCGGEDNAAVLDVATGVEFVHTASLIHDDIIDDAILRRGQPTIHNKWATKPAVLTGDLLFAAAFNLFSKAHVDVVDVMSHSIWEMSTGELNQLLTPVFDIEGYWMYIQRKTACLLGACCNAGAILAKKGKRWGNILKSFGEYLGIAYQLTDDVLDYRGMSEKLGKYTGTDFSGQIWTLPTLLAYKRGLITDNWPQADFSEICVLLEENDILNEVWLLAKDYSTRTHAILDTFPSSQAKSELEELVHMVLKRDT